MNPNCWMTAVLPSMSPRVIDPLYFLPKAKIWSNPLASSSSSFNVRVFLLGFDDYEELSSEIVSQSDSWSEKESYFLPVLTPLILSNSSYNFLPLAIWSLHSSNFSPILFLSSSEGLLANISSNRLFSLSCIPSLSKMIFSSYLIFFYISAYLCYSFNSKAASLM